VSFRLERGPRDTREPEKTRNDEREGRADGENGEGDDQDGPERLCSVAEKTSHAKPPCFDEVSGWNWPGTSGKELKHTTDSSYRSERIGSSRAALRAGM
jgi:hypothetical protein